MKLDKSTYVQKNFKLWEFKSRVTDELVLDYMLPYRLQLLRDLVGKPISIKVGYRTKEQNDKIPNADKNSYHLYGMAADIHVKDMTPKEVYPFAVKAGFSGIGVYDTWIHVDVGVTYRRWGDFEELDNPPPLNINILELYKHIDELEARMVLIQDITKGVLL